MIWGNKFNARLESIRDMHAEIWPGARPKELQPLKTKYASVAWAFIEHLFSYAAH